MTTLPETSPSVETLVYGPEAPATHALGTPPVAVELSSANAENALRVMAQQTTDSVLAMIEVCNDNGIYDYQALKVQLQGFLLNSLSSARQKGIEEGQRYVRIPAEDQTQ